MVCTRPGPLSQEWALRVLTPPCVIMSEEDSDASSVGESEGEISEPKSKTDLVKIEHLKIIRTIGTGNKRC